MIVLNDVLGYPLKIYQDKESFLFSLDSVFLGFFVTIRCKDKLLLDMGAGNGIISLILSLRTKSHIDSVELQKNSYDLLRKNISINNLNNQITPYFFDIKEFCNKNNVGKYDTIVCNPPYFKVNDVKVVSRKETLSISRHESGTSIDDFIRSASYLLKNGGNFAMSCRVDRLIEIIELFRKNNIEPKKIQFIYNNINSSSKMLFIEGQKGGKSGLKIIKPFILRNLDNTYTEEYNSFIKGDLYDKTE